MLAGLQSRDGLRGVVGNRRVDVDGVDVGVAEEVVEIGIAGLDAEAVAALIQLGPVAAANGVHFGVGMSLVDGNELRAEAEANDGDAYLFVGSHDPAPSPGCVVNG